MMSVVSKPDVMTIVGKPFDTGQPTRPTEPFIVLGSINGLELDVCYCVRVAPFGKNYGCLHNTGEK